MIQTFERTSNIHRSVVLIVGNGGPILIDLRSIHYLLIYILIIMGAKQFISFIIYPILIYIES